MRQVWISREGPPEVLKVMSSPDPKSGPKEVRVRVKASGINFADIMARVGLYPDAPSLPAVVGYEVSGIIDQVGKEVTDWKVGDEVICVCQFGGYSDTVVVHETQVFAKPAKMNFMEAASIPVNYITAYQMLFAMGSIKKEEWVLIHSIGGGVGFAAIDFCQIAGAQIIGTASKAKHAQLRKRGVEHLIDYRTQDFEKEVMKITSGRGVHIILDAVGGDSWAKGMRCLAPTGRLVVFGASSSVTGKKRNLLSAIKMVWSIPWLKMNPIALMNQNKAVVGVNLGHMWSEQEKMREWANQILKWYEEGKIHPTVDSQFSFDKASAAHHHIQDRKNVGKVLLVPA